MFHERTQQVIKARRRRAIVVVVLVCALVLGFWLGYGKLRADMHEQGAVTLRDAIFSAAKQCAAVEGSYPSSLKYLEDHYGLVVNYQDYVITYEAFASNVSPSVVVMPR